MNRRWFILFIALLAAGCAHQKRPLTDIENLERYQSRLAAVEDWRLRGKIVLRSAGESEKARVNWHNNNSDYKIRLSGTLGMGTTYLYGSPGQVRLEQSGEEPITASSPEQLVYEQLGQHIPITELKYWVRGIPAPERPVGNLALGPKGTLASLEQSGWRLDYQSYTAVGPWNLPSELTATHPEVTLTLTIDQWTLPGQTP